MKTETIQVRAAGLLIEDDSILLIEYFNEEMGLHYALPGGTVLPRETIRAALAREIQDSTCLQVEVGSLRLAYEYAPHLDPIPRNTPHSVTLIFTCRAESGKARLPDCAEREQTAVRWIPLDALDELKLSPPIQKQLRQSAHIEKSSSGWLEEWQSRA